MDSFEKRRKPIADDKAESARLRTKEIIGAIGSICIDSGIDPNDYSEKAEVARLSALAQHGLAGAYLQLDTLRSFAEPFPTDTNEKSEWYGFYTDNLSYVHYGSYEALFRRARDTMNIDSESQFVSIRNSIELPDVKHGIDPDGSTVNLYSWEQVKEAIYEWRSQIAGAVFQDSEGWYFTIISGVKHSTIKSLSEALNVDRKTIRKAIEKFGLQPQAGPSGSWRGAEVYPITTELREAISGTTELSTQQEDGAYAGFVTGADGRPYGTLTSIVARLKQENIYSPTVNALQIRIAHGKMTGINTETGRIIGRGGKPGRSAKLYSYDDIKAAIVDEPS